jgi:hypothetical protein
MHIDYNGLPVGEGALDPPTFRPPKSINQQRRIAARNKFQSVQFFRNSILAQWI